jgi:hypothetical protein
VILTRCLFLSSKGDATVKLLLNQIKELESKVAEANAAAGNDKKKSKGK